MASAAANLGLLAQYFHQFRSAIADEQKPVFWLGAGCSVHDGVPLNDRLLELIVPVGDGQWGSPQFRFDRFCERIGAGPARAALLTPHFKVDIKPDSPYHGLVALLRDGYADLVLTFNIDDVLEKAFTAAGCRENHDYLVLKCPELNPEAIAAQLHDRRAPRLKIVKLHGDHGRGINLMTSKEIVSFDPLLEPLVADFSSRAAVVCGYSFFHLNVLTVFSKEGGSFFYVNRSFPNAPMVLSLMEARSGAPLFIDGKLGCFETFIGELSAALRAHAGRTGPVAAP